MKIFTHVKDKFMKLRAKILVRFQGTNLKTHRQKFGLGLGRRFILMLPLILIINKKV